MAGLKEFDSFIGKFVSLWKNGFEASLNVNSKAGEAFINLQVGLGQVLPFLQPQHLQRRQPGPSRQRRQQRRAEARREADQVSTRNNATTEEVVNKVTEEVIKGNTVTEEVTSETTSKDPSRNVEVAVKATTEVTEEVVDDELDTIPQLDGDLDFLNEPNYCKICKDSDELETAEDLSYHMMNDHDPQDVLANYGQDWIDGRRHCIRRWSPFLNWFSTPPIL